MYVTLRGTPKGEVTSDRTVRSKVPAAVLTFGMVSLLTDISSESVNAILPLYLTAALGLTPLAYGFIDGIYQGVSAAVRLLGGWWADSTRRPKWVSFVGYLVSALSRFGLLIAGGFVAVTAVVTVDRLGKGLRTGPRDALIATASRPADLGRNFGVHRAMDTFGAMVGPLLAFAVLAVVPVGLGGYRSVFVFSAAFAVLGVVVLAVAVPDLRTRAREVLQTAAGGPEGSGEVSAPTRRRIPLRLADLNRPGLRRVLAVAALLGVATVGDGFIYLTLASNGALAATWFPLLFVGTNAVYLALAVPLGKLADRVGRGLVFVTGHAVLIGVYILAAVGAGGIAGVVVVLALLGTFYAATDGVLAALATQQVPEESRASGIAAAQTVVAAARFVSSVGFGLLWTLTSQRSALVVVAVILAITLTVAVWLLRGRLRSAQVAAA